MNTSDFMALNFELSHKYCNIQHEVKDVIASNRKTKVLGKKRKIYTPFMSQKQ